MEDGKGVSGPMAEVGRTQEGHSMVMFNMRNTSSTAISPVSASNRPTPPLPTTGKYQTLTPPHHPTPTTGSFPGPSSSTHSSPVPEGSTSLISTKAVHFPTSHLRNHTPEPSCLEHRLLPNWREVRGKWANKFTAFWCDQLNLRAEEVQATWSGLSSPKDSRRTGRR